jgi:hypothetical protein
MNGFVLYIIVNFFLQIHHCLVSYILFIKEKETLSLTLIGDFECLVSSM